jgi:hypothetical protein
MNDDSSTNFQEQQDFELLDAITIVSFMMQLQMYGKNITIGDMQTNIRNAVQEIEDKIDDLDKHLVRIEEVLKHEDD